MTDFLKNLKESLETGVKNEELQSTVVKILEKAEEIGSNPALLEKVESKAVQAQESRKPLNEEEQKEIEFLAMKQQQKIDEFEFKTMLSATLVNIDLAIEKLSYKIAEFKLSSEKLRDETLSLSEKKKVMKEVLKDINKIEAPIPKKEQFSITDENFLLSK